MIYSLLGTAKLNGLNPRAYLRHALERIAEHPSKRIDELLPWAVAVRLRQLPEPLRQAAPVHKPQRADFRRGDKVSFTDKYLQPQVGTITRINQRTASVDCEGGSGWRVPLAMLRHITDI